jgi:hypothetical protein
MYSDVECKDGKKETPGDIKRRKARNESVKEFADKNKLILVKSDVSCNKSGVIFPM